MVSAGSHRKIGCGRVDRVYIVVWRKRLWRRVEDLVVKDRGGNTALCARCLLRRVHDAVAGTLCRKYRALASESMMAGGGFAAQQFFLSASSGERSETGDPSSSFGRAKLGPGGADGGLFRQDEERREGCRWELLPLSTVGSTGDRNTLTLLRRWTGLR